MRQDVSLNQIVAQRIAQTRRSARLTLEDVANQLGWPLSTLHNYESGRRPLKLDQLEAIAAVLHVPPAALLASSDAVATIIMAVEPNDERCAQVQMFLATLAEEGVPDS